MPLLHVYTVFFSHFMFSSSQRNKTLQNSLIELKHKTWKVNFIFQKDSVAGFPYTKKIVPLVSSQPKFYQSHLVLNIGADDFAFNFTGGIVRIFPILFVELNDVVSDELCRALVELEVLLELFCWCCWCCFCSWRHFALLFLNQT